VSENIGWDRRLSVVADGKGIIGHVGAVLLRKCADQAGLTAALSAALARRGRLPGWDRGVVLVQLAVVIVLGARSMTDIALLEQQAAVFGAPASDSTVRRALVELDAKATSRIRRARVRVRAHVWDLLAARDSGFAWVSVARRVLTGWIVVDIDATLITAHSDKQGAAATFKKGWGFHPLGAWCANTGEALSMLLRPGNAGANTVADHLVVLEQAIAAIPAAFRAKILIRIDGAGATHELLERIQALNTTRRVVRFCVGWKITPADEDAIAALPASTWTSAVDQNGELQDDCHVAEITGLNARMAGWPPGTRLIVRRSRPSRRHERKLTDFEKATGWRYQITAIDYVRMRGVPGSHHPWFADVLYRQRGGAAEGRVRTNKAMGLANLPSQTWDVNVGWVLAANLAADLDAWTRLLGLHDHPELAAAEPGTLRYRLWHLPARLVSHARRRILKIPIDWPWADAFTTCWRRLTALPHPS
jgi:hypothetical protein